MVLYAGLDGVSINLFLTLEAFAMQNGPWASFLDGVGSGLGYAWVLIAVAFVRELLGNGTLLGMRVIPESLYVEQGGFYVNNGMMTMPAMALILVGCIIWAQRAYNGTEE